MREIMRIDWLLKNFLQGKKKVLKEETKRGSKN
jgi:hypothetical protein